LVAGTCTTLYWETENVQAVFLDGQPVIGSGAQQTCPCENESHTLEITLRNGDQVTRQVTLQVRGSCITPTPDLQGPPPPVGSEPADEAVLTCRAVVELSWLPAQDPAGVSGYYVRTQVTTYSPTPNEILEWGPVTETSLDVPVSCGLGYRWSVRAVDGAGNLGPWSNWLTFGIGID